MPARPGPRQLTLALGHVERLAREDFLSGASNAAALALIDCWPDWPDQAVVLAGPEGCGKSHLAAIWAEAAGARFLSARSVAAEAVPAALATGALVVEDIAADQFDERAMFHLLNLAREEQAFVLVTARSLPAGWAIDLRDLASRLKALPVVSVGAPDDALLRAVLVKLFGDRQLAVDESLVTFLARRIDRSVAAARAIVAELDREAMQQGRPLSRLLAAEVRAAAAARAKADSRLPEASAPAAEDEEA
jgi:chromosomal replication initiation ATPase DnaA